MKINVFHFSKVFQFPMFFFICHGVVKINRKKVAEKIFFFPAYFMKKEKRKVLKKILTKFYILIIFQIK